MKKPLAQRNLTALTISRSGIRNCLPFLYFLKPCFLIRLLSSFKNKLSNHCIKMKSKFPSSSGGSISLPGPPPLAHRSTRPGSTSSNDVRELAFMHFRLVPLCLALIFGTTSWGDAQSLLCYHNKNRHSRRCAYRVFVRTPRPREATNHLQTRHLVAASMGHLCGMQAIPT